MSRLKSVVKTLNAKARAKAPAREQYSDAELRELEREYADLVEGRVVTDMSDVPDHLIITPDMPAREAAERYAGLLQWMPPAR